MATLLLPSKLQFPTLNPISLKSPTPHKSFPFIPLTSPSNLQITRSNSTPPTTTTTTTTNQSQPVEEDYLVLAATRSEYNNIVILESENSKVLLLDDSGNVHSILYKGRAWTGSYWDEFTSLPAVIPHGPIAIFGLGGGTVAHQLLEFWPGLRVDGWELDGVLVDKARKFFGVSELENGNEAGGFLRVCVGDALCAKIEGGYAGIVVDLFADAKVLPELEREETWVGIKEKLMPDGRIMVNCGAASSMSKGSGWEVNLVIEALCRALGGQDVNWKKMPDNEGGNYMALTGPLPDLEKWAGSVPGKLGSSVKLWRPCQP